MPVELPESVAEQTRDLGEPAAHFQASTVQMVLYFLFGLIAYAVGAACFVILLFGLSRPVRTTMMGVVLLGSGTGLLLKWRSLLGTRVIVFDRGLARLQKGDCEVMRWEEIDTVRRGVPPENNQLTITKPSHLILVGPEGKEWLLTEAISGLKDLRALVEERTLRLLLPPAVDVVKRGQTLWFDALGVRQDGLICAQNGFLAWDALADIGVRSGVLSVTGQFANRSHFAAPAYRMPNLHLLLALVDRLRS